MSVRNDIEFIVLLAEVGAQERKEHYQKQYIRAPYGLAAEITADKCGRHRARYKRAYHQKMGEHLAPRLFISASKPLDKIRADLTDMISAEGRCHGYLFCLAEGVELH